MSKTIPLKKQSIKEIDMSLVGFYVERYWSGDRYNPNHTAIAEAAINLERAFAERDYQQAQTDTSSWKTSDAEAMVQARTSLDIARANGAIDWGVPRANLPSNPQAGETITIHYNDHKEHATVVGFVADVVEYPQGKGLVLRLLETNNSFNLRCEGWRYIGLWIPSYRTAQAGFVKYPTAPINP